jgi:hypothetical protein
MVVQAVVGVGDIKSLTLLQALELWDRVGQGPYLLRLRRPAATAFRVVGAQ